jgi:hypothetical protein
MLPAGPPTHTVAIGVERASAALLPHVIAVTRRLDTGVRLSTRAARRNFVAVAA